MSSIYLVANEVLFTSYGHLQLVYDPDDAYFNGDEREFEVQGPFFAVGDWDVRPEQEFDTPFGVSSLAVELSFGVARSAGEIWQVLGEVRDSIAAQPIDYRLGLIGGLEGQNSNSYITTLAHAVGLDIAGAIAAVLASPIFSSFPGLARNVLFDHLAADDSLLPPVTLDIDGSDGADVLAGGDGADSLRAGSGHDTVNGFGGNDTLSGGRGRDTLIGGAGDDALAGEGGRDRLFGDAGADRLDGNGKSDRLAGGAGDDELFGGSGADFLFGNGGADLLRGGAGDDRLSGGTGHDTLSGLAGSDTLTGGKGNDVLTGGLDADVFVFDGKVREGRDRITDFEDGIDLIRIEGLTLAQVAVSGIAEARLVLDGLTEIVLTGVSAADIGVADFEFV
jgi:Ca2+-binding RTX toxin-like protein